MGMIKLDRGWRLTAPELMNFNKIIRVPLDKGWRTSAPGLKPPG